jgi:8-oxo-dGTP diphosphatase
MNRQRASAIIVKDNKVLVVRISDKGRSWWCLPGGTIVAVETPEEAIVRELREELNLKVIPRQRLFQVPMIHEVGTDYGILVDSPSQMPIVGVDPTVVDWDWRSLDELDDIWQAVEVKKALALQILSPDDE